MKARIDAGLLNDAKTLALSPSAFRLFVLARCLCAANLTDGRIAANLLQTPLGARRRDIQELVDAGVWDRLQTGTVVDNTYLKDNPSRADVERQREKVRRHRAGKRTRDRIPDPDTVTETVSEAVSEAVSAGGTPDVSPPHTPPPISPDPSVSSESYSGSGSRIPPYQPPDRADHVARAGRKSRQKRGACGVEIPLPDGWVPNQKHAAKARELGLDLELEAERFRERALAKGLLYVDWGRAFNTWLLSPYAQQRARLNGAGGAPAQSRADAQLQRQLERIRRLEAEEEAAQ